MPPSPAPAQLDHQVAEILKRYPEIAAAYLFGSRARGDARPGSDLDVGLVLRDPHAELIEHQRWLRDLASRLETVCPGARVDLVLLGSHQPILAHRVLCEGKRVYEADRRRRVDFESDTIVRALDFLPTHDFVARHRIDGMRSWLKGRR